MPELPEVETVRLGLLPILKNKCIVKCEQFRPDLRWPLPENMSDRLNGNIVNNIMRRSKYLLFDLSSGETLIVHLGMSGRLLVIRDEIEGSVSLASFYLKAQNYGQHDHIIIHVEGGTRIIYNDPRRFGAMDLFETERIMEHKWLSHLGPEPLSDTFSTQALMKILKNRKSCIKTALLNQKLIAGLGNIYVLESLWEAGVSPERPANRISKVTLERLVFCIQKVLRAAIALGGTSLKDFRQVGGDLGYFQNKLKVYGRDGKKCLKLNCSGRIKTIKHYGRTSFYCSHCQK